jgi:SAM-dependent methyltransferase
MFIPEIKGLKYPDDYIIKFFFKNNLSQSNGTVLEIGPSNGNNLLLFYEYGWNVTGVDISSEAISMANENFARCQSMYNLKNSYIFHEMDMIDYVKNNYNKFDIILLPGSFYYTNIFNINKLFESIAANRMLNDNGLFFLRFRSPEDYRYGKGEKIGHQTFRFNFDTTGEKNCINTFFFGEELLGLLNQYFKLENIVNVKNHFENIQDDQLINNSDTIIWANIKY